MAKHILELAKSGVWGKDASPITKADLKEVVETFAGSKPAVIGHIENQTSPKFGDVERLWLSADGETLLGEVTLLEAAEKLYADGHYNGWSVSIPRRAVDGKRYFHHLAFLGAVPPKIPGLKELPLEEVSYGEGDNAESFAFGGKIQEVQFMDGELEKMKAEVEKLAKEKEALAKELAALKKAEPVKKPEEKPKSVFGDDNAAAGRQSAEYADMQKQIADLKAAESKTRLSSFSDTVAAKLPEGVREKANRLAQSVEGVRGFEFADGKKEDALSLLKDVLSLWPSPVVSSVASEFADSAGSGSDKEVDWGKVAKGM